MNKEEIISKINSVLAEEFEKDESEMVPDANLLETLELDSLDIVDMVVFIEQTFGVVVKGADFKDIRTFQDFYDFLYRRVNNEL